jgi:hypothetical protein
MIVAHHEWQPSSNIWVPGALRINQRHHPSRKIRTIHALSSLTRFLLILSILSGARARFCSASCSHAHIQGQCGISAPGARSIERNLSETIAQSRAAHLFPFFRCGRAGVGARVLGKTKQGDFPHPSPLLPHLNSTTCRLTTPIDPVLKQDRRGIGKRKLGNSV